MSFLLYQMPKVGAAKIDLCGKFLKSSRKIKDDYAKDGGPVEVWLLCSFYQEPLHTSIKTNVNKFAISPHTALKLGIQAMRSYLKLTYEYELFTLSNAAKDRVSGLHKSQTAPGPPSLA